MGTEVAHNGFSVKIPSWISAVNAYNIHKQVQLTNDVFMPTATKKTTSSFGSFFNN